MKTWNKVAIGFALGMAALVGSTASAGTICTGCEYKDGFQATYLGSHDPTLQDQSTFTNTQMAPGAFADIWFFELNPGGLATVNAIFSPKAASPNLLVEFFGGCNPLGPVGAPGSGYNGGGTCTTLLATGTGSPGESEIVFQNLTAGFYAFRVSGTVINGPSAESYSGNLNTFIQQEVPEPGSLALLGLGLLGLGASRRRFS